MRKNIVVFVSLIIVLLLGACAPVVPVEDTAPATEAPAGAVEEAQNRTLTVLAAASLTESFTEIGAIFQERNPGVSISFNFAGSQQLAQQLAQGAQADLFASASPKYMDAAVQSGRVAADAARIFVNNRLVVIYPTGNPAQIESLQDLARPGLKLDLADPTVPVGAYSVEFLEKASGDPAFGSDYQERVLANVVSYEENVKAVVTKVSLGEVDAGIVYVSDAAVELGKTVETIEIPDELNSIARYPIATIADSKQAELGAAFLELILSPEGAAILEEHGFLPVETGDAAEEGFVVTDALGREVAFEKAPERIVLVGKGVIMVADAIYTFPEAGEKIAAISTTKQGSANFIPMIDPTFEAKVLLESNAGAEQIAAVQPDCVILKSVLAETLGVALDAVQIPVVYVDFETPDQYERDLAMLGSLFQNPQRAAEVTAFYQEKTEAVSQAVADLSEEEKPRTLLLYYSDKDGTVAFNVPAMSWIQTWMITTAGGAPVWAEANPGNGWATVSLEQVAAWNPDVIFVVSYATPVEEIVAGLKADAKWQALDAMKNEQVYAFATDVYSWDQPDTRWVLGLQWVAKKLHPNRFAELDIDQAAAEFYEELYGMDATSFQENIVPLYQGDVH